MEDIKIFSPRVPKEGIKLFYRVKVKDNKEKEYTEFFSSYEAIKDMLNKYFSSETLQKLNIDTLIMCDECEKYDEPSCYLFLQNRGKLNTYCIECRDKYRISKYDFEFKKEKNDD